MLPSAILTLYLFSTVALGVNAIPIVVGPGAFLGVASSPEKRGLFSALGSIGRTTRIPKAGPLPKAVPKVPTTSAPVSSPVAIGEPVKIPPVNAPMITEPGATVPPGGIKVSPPPPPAVGEPPVNTQVVTTPESTLPAPGQVAGGTAAPPTAADPNPGVNPFFGPLTFGGSLKQAAGETIGSGLITAGLSGITSGGFGQPLAPAPAAGVPATAGGAGSLLAGLQKRSVLWSGDMVVSRSLDYLD